LVVRKVYLETSFFSACVSTRTSDKSKGWRASSLEWWQIQARRFELFISPTVAYELSSRDFPAGEKALAMPQGLRLLTQTTDVIALAELLVKERVMPKPPDGGDALHVATATLHRMDYVLTWNIRHMANPNKRTHFGVICMRLGLTPPMFVTPDFIQESDDD
jgi:hypothetical protein